jgi:glycosyltransferase involved in cell wall biosynthesis
MTHQLSSCTVIYYGGALGAKNGETIKGENICILARTLFSKVSLFSTSGWQKHPLISFIRLLFSIHRSSFVFLVLSSNGTARLGRILIPICKIKKTKLFYFMVGVGPLLDEYKLDRTAGGLTRYFQNDLLWKKSTSRFSKTFKRFDHVFVETPTLVELCSTIYQTRNVSVLTNFRNFQEHGSLVCPFTVRPGKPLSFIFFARITPSKGIVDLLEVFSRLAREHYSFLLDIYGYIQMDKSSFEKLVNIPGVHYKGMATISPVLLLASYDCMVFPTKHFEGMPGTLVESLFAGTPVVSSKFTFAQDIIKNGETGFLYDFDDIEGLYGCLKSIILNPHILDSMRKKCIDKSSDFTLEKASSALLECCQEGTNHENS